MVGVPLEEPTLDRVVLVEDVPPEEAEQEKISMDSQDSPPPRRKSGRKCKPPGEHLNFYER